MRVFSILVSWSNENKSYMRVDVRELTNESLYESSSLLDSHVQESCIGIGEGWQEIVSVRIFRLSCPGQTRTRVVWELMRVEKREFA